MTAPRTHWRVLALTEDYTAEKPAPAGMPERYQVKNIDHANVVASLGSDGKHYPVLDLDGIGVTIADSSTPGNCHLFIDHPVEWAAYVKLLEALAECGIIQPGYASASIERGATYVRTHPDKHDGTPPQTGRARIEPGERLRAGPAPVAGLRDTWRTAALLGPDPDRLDPADPTPF